MPTISLCMIVKNEENTLPRCLDSVRAAADEIIIVDTGSLDNTVELAKKYTDIVVSFPWHDDFSAARNYAYSLARMDYQLWLDADDVLRPEDLQKLIGLKHTLPASIDLVTMRYILASDDGGRPSFFSTRERLTRTAANYRWIDPVHECIPLYGNMLHSDIAVTHMHPPERHSGDRNLLIFQKMETDGHSFSPRQLYYYAREQKDHGLFAPAAENFEKFLRTEKGWIEDNITACRCLAECHEKLTRDGETLAALMRSFEYAPPRAEICCDAGYYHMRRGEYTRALRWFSLAMRPPGQPGHDNLGFSSPDSSGFIPNIESCVCCCALGDYENAAQYNRAAAAFKPGHPSVINNEEYLRSITADN